MHYHACLPGDRYRHFAMHLQDLCQAVDTAVENASMPGIVELDATNQTENQDKGDPETHQPSPHPPVCFLKKRVSMPQDIYFPIREAFASAFVVTCVAEETDAGIPNNQTRCLFITLVLLTISAPTPLSQPRK